MVTKRKKKSPPASGDGEVSHDQHEHDNIGSGKKTDPKIPDNNIPASTDRKTANHKSETIILDPVVTLAEVSHLKESFMASVGPHNVQVDVSKVEHIDTAALQLLLSFSKALEKQGGKIVWQGWSAECSKTAELLGLSSALKLEVN